MIANNEKIEVIGVNPSARFGHTITQITKYTCVLFGGVIKFNQKATGDTGKYNFSNETFIFDNNSRQWKKLDCLGVNPTPRAAHASTAIETNQVVIYGGAAGGGQLAIEDLWLLDLRNNDNQPTWTIVPTIGKNPGKRYGHTITYSRPYLVLFAGNTGSEPVNDTWVLNVELSPFQWQKLEFNTLPQARAYHTTALCVQGFANGMIVSFGGRAQDQKALNDTWGLRRHRDGHWDWISAPYRQNQEQPQARYQHTCVFMNSAMIVMAGRTNNVTEQLQMDIYDTENSEWYKFSTIQRFRHSNWLLDVYLYVYGGFELDQV